MKLASSILYYVHDPMCSWCWGFREIWLSVQQQLPENIQIRYLLGGLAHDTSELMPKDMQANIHDTWQTIQKEIIGTEFNFNFWDECKPRRSTYPSCRAVIASRKQNPSLEQEMILAIQHAYYLHAKNPSDNDVLIELAKNLGLDAKQFENDMLSSDTQEELSSEIKFSRELGVQGFPGLVYECNGNRKLLQLDYNVADVVLRQIV